MLNHPWNSSVSSIFIHSLEIKGPCLMKLPTAKKFAIFLESIKKTRHIFQISFLLLFLCWHRTFITKVSFFWDQSPDMSWSSFPPLASDWLTNLVYQIEACFFGGKLLELMSWLRSQKKLTLVGKQNYVTQNEKKKIRYVDFHIPKL